MNKTRFKKNVFLRRRGMTLMEILMVASLMSLVSLALYKAFADGVRIWQQSQRLVIEEDISIFFDKMAQDLKNSFPYAKITFEGGEHRFAFPAVISVPVDRKSGLSEDSYVDQIGKVEYYFDILDRALYRRQANYSQALNYTYATPRQLVPKIDKLRFQYYYLTDEGELVSDEALNVFPSAIEILVQFSDQNGQRTMRKFIDVPRGS